MWGKLFRQIIQSLQLENLKGAEQQSFGGGYRVSNYVFTYHRRKNSQEKRQNRHQDKNCEGLEILKSVFKFPLILNLNVITLYYMYIYLGYDHRLSMKCTTSASHDFQILTLTPPLPPLWLTSCSKSLVGLERTAANGVIQLFRVYSVSIKHF